MIKNMTNENTKMKEEVEENALSFDLEKTKNEVELKIQNSPEVQNIIKQIDLNDMNTVINFGGNTAIEISKFADKILHSMETIKVEDSGELLFQLNKIMDKFDIKDFEEKKKGLVEKLFNKAKKSIDALFKKYHTMGQEVDKVFVILKEYEVEIYQTNAHLDEMFGKNLEYYEQLEKYICAGEMVLEYLKNEVIPDLENKINSLANELDQINYNNAKQIEEMVDQRIYDLKLAKNIALQSMPSIKTIQQGNYNLIRKINSAFIITLPIFKQCLTQSIMLKRQAVQAKATKALDDKTNELLLRNAENIALQSKMTAKLASGSFANIETLERSWQTIMHGIEETKQIQAEMKQKRIEGSKRLAELQNEYQNKKLFA